MDLFHGNFAAKDTSFSVPDLVKVNFDMQFLVIISIQFLLILVLFVTIWI